MRELLSPDGSRSIDNGTLLHTMFDMEEREIAGVPRATPPRNNIGSVVKVMWMTESSSSVNNSSGGTQNTLHLWNGQQSMDTGFDHSGRYIQCY